MACRKKSTHKWKQNRCFYLGHKNLYSFFNKNFFFVNINIMKKPSIFRRTIMFIVDSWRVVMDVKYNPLKHIPDPSLQTYFMLILFTIWSVAFGLIAIFWLGFIGYNIMTSIIVHLSVLIPLAFTNAVFIDAERDGEKWLKEWREEQSRYRIIKNRLKTKNLVLWNPYKEA